MNTSPHNSLSECDAYMLFWSYCIAMHTSELKDSPNDRPWKAIPAAWSEGLHILLNLSRLTRTPSDLRESERLAYTQDWKCWCLEHRNQLERFSIEIWMNEQLIHKHDSKALFHPLWMAIASKCSPAIQIALDAGNTPSHDFFHEAVSRELIDFTVQPLLSFTETLASHGFDLWRGLGLKGFAYVIPVVSQSKLKELEFKLLGDETSALERWRSAPRSIRREALMSALHAGHAQWFSRVGKALMSKDLTLCHTLPGEVSFHAHFASYGVSRSGVSPARSLAIETQLWQWLSTLPIDWDRVVVEPNAIPVHFLDVCTTKPTDEVKLIWSRLPILQSSGAYSNGAHSLTLELESLALQHNITNTKNISRKAL